MTEPEGTDKEQEPPRLVLCRAAAEKIIRHDRLKSGGAIVVSEVELEPIARLVDLTDKLRGALR